MNLGVFMYRRLCYSDRVRIETLLKLKMKPIKIAEILGVSRQAISYEIKKGRYRKLTSDLLLVDSYSADIAQQKTDFEASSKGPRIKLGNDYELVSRIEALMADHYSPKAIIVKLKAQGKLSTEICWRTLYNYIYAGYINGKLTYKPRKKKAQRVRKPARYGTSIDLRPQCINSRLEFGHWEGDSVLGKRDSGETLLVYTERLTRFEIVLRCHKRADETARAFLKLKSWCPEIFKSVTYDNGSEFSRFDQIERSGTKVYFCHPYSSWERGSNEKQNQMIRRKILKGSRIESYSDDQISSCQRWLNNYPREIFGWRSAAEIFADECEKIGVDVKNLNFF